MTASVALAELVVHWQAQHGRNHLPWQQSRDPYRVWLSEIMLQQTQVATVLDYYPRFLARCPDVSSLAQASEDEVLGLWSGLGYYSRARNLHRCAQVVVQEYGGEFPRSAALLATLPGIGRSTAGAIAAFCFAERVPILDANVRRVLSRWLAFEGDLAVAAHERQLWEQAQALLPSTDLDQTMPRYTQGLMDLGAMVCLSRKPDCAQCPLQGGCAAFAQGQPERLPVKTRKLVRKSAAWWLLLLCDSQNRIWLHKRPASGIWAGLQCPPILPSRAQALEHPALSGALAVDELAPFLHVLTHRDLHLHPVVVRLASHNDWRAPAEVAGDWFSPAQWQVLGLPAPVRKLLEDVVKPRLF